MKKLKLIPIEAVLIEALADRRGRVSFLIGSNQADHDTGFLFTGTLKQAQQAAREYGRVFNLPFSIKQIRPLITCPTCGQKKDYEAIEAVGECLECEHNRQT